MELARRAQCARLRIKPAHDELRANCDNLFAVGAERHVCLRRALRTVPRRARPLRQRIAVAIGFRLAAIDPRLIQFAAGFGGSVSSTRLAA